jgi:hypothetical protein
MKKLILLITVLLFFNELPAQLNETTTKTPVDPHLPIPERISAEDSVKMASIPVIPIPLNYKDLPTLPYVVDNSLTPYLRPVFNQSALECGQASGIGMGFTYAMDWTRDLDADSIQNQYPTHFAWNFMNNGANQGVSFFDTWMVLRDYGTPNIPDWGGTFSYGGPTRWMTGYTYYYNAMHNRLEQVYAIPVRNEQELHVLKHWIHDHLDGSAAGGVANYYASVPSLTTLAPGTPEAGKKVITSWSYANHGMTIVGYNDSIRYDYNLDGQYTNNIDITGDGIVDLKDWEIGGLKMCNTYGGGPTWGDQGFAYFMYRTLAMPYGSGGIWSNTVYVQYCRENTEPLLTMKITLKHNSRNKIKVTTGVSADTTATYPSFIQEYPVFKYQGGNNYMQGTNTSETYKTLEFGLDVTSLLNKIGSGNPARYFLMVREDDASNAGTGFITNFSLMDYTGSTVTEVPYPQTNVPITENGLKLLAINRTVVYDQVLIADDTLAPATVYDPYSFQLTPDGGLPPYKWEFDRDFTVHDSTATFPTVTAVDLFTSSSNNGTVTQPLLFSFPFYGNNYTSIKINVDGFIMFNAMPSNWPYQMDNVNFFVSHESVSPFYCNLNMNTTLGNHIWFEGNSNYATVRWKVQLNGQNSTEVNFAVRLYPSGKIEFYYGTMTYPASTYWFAGIFNGDGYNYQYTGNSGLPSITGGSLIEFTRNEFPPELSISNDGIISGIPLQEYFYYPVKIKLTDGSRIVTRKTVYFHTIGINSIVITGHDVDSGNDNMLEAGETALMTVNLENYGSVTFSNVSMMITTDDPEITLTDSTQYIGYVDSGEVFTLQDAFLFTVSDEIPDNYTFNFGTYIYTPADTFHSHIILTAHAPVVSLGNVTVQDGDNMSLDPGETATVEVNLINNGGGKAVNINSLVSTSDPYVTVTSSTDFLDTLYAANTGTVSCTVIVSSACPLQHIVNFTITLTGSYSFGYNGSFSLPVGQVIEDFNLGYYSLPNWNFGGNAHWYATTEAPYEGNDCARSGLITNSQQTWFSITSSVVSAGNISFWYKVSCENDPNGTNYDYLAFYLDGLELSRWDGEIGWTQASYPVGTGSHTFKWNYVKDYSVNAGSDCAWVDYIVFPAMVNSITQISGINDTRPGLLCYPNPFNDKTFISCFLDKPSTVSLEILDKTGRKVAVPAYNKMMDSGNAVFTWDGRDISGNILTDGVYFARFISDESSVTGKIVLMR